MDAVFVLVVAGAIGIGLVVNRVMRDRVLHGDDIDPINDLAGRIMVLAVFFLAFALASASSSFGQARDAVRSEAEAIDNFFEYAQFTGEPERQRLTGDSVCYVRGVLHDGWSGHAQVRSEAINHWTGDFREVFQQLHEAQDPLFSSLVSADNERSDSRRQRLAEASANTPWQVYLFITIIMGVALGTFAFSLPSARNRTYIIGLSVFGVLLMATMFLIQDLEQPFSGWVQVLPAQLEDVKVDITTDYLDDYPAESLPCDRQGRPN